MKQLKRALVMLCVFVLVYMIQMNNGELVKAEEVCVVDSISIIIEDYILVETNSEELDFENVEVRDSCENIVSDVEIRVIYDFLDISKEGIYTVSIMAQYNSWSDHKEITVEVKDDITPPEINGVKDKYYFKVDTELTRDDFLDGVTISDNFDLDISIDDIQVGNESVYANIEGTYTVTFYAEDSSNNLSSTIETQFIIVEEIPKLINGEDKITLEVLSTLPDLKDGYSARFEDEDIEFEVNSSELDLDIIGTYEIIYTAEVYNIIDTKTVEVNVVDTTPPEIKGIIKLEVKKGFDFIPSRYLKAFDNYDEDVKLIFRGDFDTDKPGKYLIKATATDQSDNQTEVIFTLTVVKNNNTILWVSIILGTGIIIGSATLYYIRKKRMF